MNIMISPRKHFSFHKKSLIIVSISIIIIALGVTIVVSRLHTNAANKVATDTPIFQTVLPTGKTIATLGGWHRVSPPDNAPVYAYTDSINNVPINVSEQSLPNSFKSSPTADVADIAKSFNATTKIAANSTDAYIGTSASGPQSVIFTKNGVLVLMKSQQKIENESWLRYIDSLI